MKERVVAKNHLACGFFQAARGDDVDKLGLDALGAEQASGLGDSADAGFSN
jgi:hypothetical protein